MGELQPLGYSLYVVGRVIDGGRGVSILVHIRRESRLPSCGYH